MGMFVKQRICVVAADWAIRSVLTEALRDEGYIVESTHDGEMLFSDEGIIDFMYDLVIINLITRENEHCQWLYDLHHRVPHLPIIVISDFHSAPEMRSNLMACGITDLFPKLFNLNDVLRCVERVLHSSRLIPWLTAGKV